jgi:protocatechuate 3,4-dioxygenase beta subunit
MNRFVAVCALSALVAACESRPPGAPSTQIGGVPPSGPVTFTVSGTVKDAAGQPVADVYVEAMSQTDCPGMPNLPDSYNIPCTSQQHLGADYTDSAGAFAISNVPVGYVEVVARHNGATVAQGVSVGSDSTLSLILY